MQSLKINSIRSSEKRTRNHIPLEKEKKIIQDYNSGMKRSEIRKKYNITEWQFVSIIKKTIRNEETNTIIAHPKHFKFP